MSATLKTFRDFYGSFMKEAHECIDLVRESEVEAVVDALWEAYRQDSRVWIAGNGGSASTAIHLGCCFGHGTMVAGKRPLRAESLCGNISTLTAIGNDFSYDQVFVQQLQVCMSPGDVFIAISCSGNSPNVVAAAEYARASGARVISFLGFSGGKLKELSHHSIYIDNYNYGQVETIHVSLGHLITQYLKQRIAES